MEFPILTALRQTLTDELGGTLLGLYVTGSYVWGDFDEERSDIDLVAVLDCDPDEALLEHLRPMHEGIEERFPSWADRVEVIYAGREMLQNALIKDGVLAVISPGEPLHILPATEDWHINWYLALHYGRVLFGQPPEQFMPSISQDRFVSIIRHQAEMWRTYIQNTRPSLPYQCYACMTMCRAAYAISTGEQASKKRAVEWYGKRHPESRELLGFCWRVCRETCPEDVSPEVFFPVAEGFVQKVLGEIAEES